MRAVERYLVGLEALPWSAVWRMGLGLTIPPVFSVIAGGKELIWPYLALFVGLLLALRVAPALFRFALPVSQDAKEAWRKRRFIAKDYDSYQWQKLFWIGLGMLPHAFIGSGLGAGGRALLAICLIGGGAGLVTWLKLGAGRERTVA